MMRNFSIVDLVARLKLWSLLAFPAVGYGLGVAIKFMIALFLGWKHSTAIEIWFTHFSTMSIMINVLDRAIYSPGQPQEDPKEKAFFFCFIYLGLFGFCLGLTP